MSVGGRYIADWWQLVWEHESTSNRLDDEMAASNEDADDCKLALMAAGVPKAYICDYGFMGTDRLTVRRVLSWPA